MGVHQQLYVRALTVPSARGVGADAHFAVLSTLLSQQRSVPADRQLRARRVGPTCG